ncbi:alpha/beta hydrolase [Olleya marilimosa]|uniref:alpha/beta hydrolase n=1 Tax=Olleya marilimosa TaxID=272164 RepID=UPI0030ED81DB|tara:strand:+ start:245860 stop:246789 length:930 start_codon:yes stop_codon:yes gene_type:complete
MKKHLVIFLLFIFSTSVAQEATYTSKEVTISKHINGTLLTSIDANKPDLAILIAGYGPTDRDGNQNFLKTNNIKKLAIGLTKNGIATFRYDKRIVKQIRQNNVDKNLSFDDFVTDAIDVLDYFKNLNQYNKIYIVGHDQGSLIGMLAAKDKADGFISIAGAGQTIDSVIIEQIEKTAPQFTADTKRIFNILKSGKTTTDYPVALSSIFNIETQRFFMSWMKHNPVDIISTLNIPTLIINGTKDLQVSEAEALLLKEAAKDASIQIIKNMNHVMVTIAGDDLENSKSYNESQRPLADGLLEKIISFITSK